MLRLALLAVFLAPVSRAAAPVRSRARAAAPSPAAAPVPAGPAVRVLSAAVSTPLPAPLIAPALAVTAKTAAAAAAAAVNPAAAVDAPVAALTSALGVAALAPASADGKAPKPGAPGEDAPARLDALYDGSAERPSAASAGRESDGERLPPSSARPEMVPPSEPPPSAPAPRAKRAGRFAAFLSFPLVIWNFVATFSVTQFGIEALGVVIPQRAGSMENAGFGLSAAVATFSTLGLAAGGILGSPLTRAFGAWGAYGTTLGGRAAAVGAMAGLAYFGVLGPIGLLSLFTLDYVFLGASRTVEAVIAKRALGGDVLRLGNFATLKNFLTDGIGMLGPILMGLAFQSFGAASSFYWVVFTAYAGAFAASAAVAALNWRLTRAAASAAAAAKAADEGPKPTFREAWNAIRANATLRHGVLAYAVLYAFNISIYFVLGPVFGYYASGGDLAAAGQITSLLAGFNAAGGIASYYWFNGRVARIEAATAALPDAGREKARRLALKALTAKLTLAGAGGLLAFWAYFAAAPLLVVPVLGLLVPVFAAQLIMLPMGFVQSASLNGLETLIQAELPDRLDDRGMALVKFSSYAANALISSAFGAILGALALSATAPTAAALLGLNLAITALASLILLTGRRLLRAS